MFFSRCYGEEEGAGVALFGMPPGWCVVYLVLTSYSVLQVLSN